MNAPTAESTTADYDAVIVGAGFSGLRMLHEMRTQGLTARVLEAGADIGGTWHWNRYPGARTDSESWVYCFWFDKALQEEWEWTERFPQQPEVERYLKHVADRFDMRRDIDFGSRVVSAHFDESANLWTVATEHGVTYRCTYLVCGSGLLSITKEPPFPGLASFRGECLQTSNWPIEKVDFAGKRVAVIGTGASGVQVIPIVAMTADQLTVYQRTPNYVLPGRNRLLDEDEKRSIKTNYEQIWNVARKQAFGFDIESPQRNASDVTSEQEFQQVLEAGWEAGGFRYVFETFDDLLLDADANEKAAEFVRHKIRAIVRDPETAELLCPKGYPLGGKRPPLGHWYYETFNRPNVDLISVRDNPIAEITPTGLRLEDGHERAVDVIVFALGFDAVTGAMTAIDIKGRDGRTVREEWSKSTNNFLGTTVEGFPNLFMLLGPGGPFANAPVLVEYQAEWIGAAIAHARQAGTGVVEPTPEAAEMWTGICQEIQDATVLRDGAANGGSWFVGANIPGKRQAALYYFGGVAAYSAALAEEIEKGFPNVVRVGVQ